MLTPDQLARWCATVRRLAPYCIDPGPLKTGVCDNAEELMDLAKEMDAAWVEWLSEEART
jgi:hypothetical protein